MPWKLFCTVMHKDGQVYQIYTRRELSPEESDGLDVKLYEWGIGLAPLALKPDFRVTPSVFNPSATYTLG